MKPVDRYSTTTVSLTARRKPTMTRMALASGVLVARPVSCCLDGIAPAESAARLLANV
jgi:hypothetical protein